MLGRIGAEALHRDAGVFLHLVLGDALLPELLEARQFGHFLTCVFIALAQPLIVSLALGVFVFNTEALGQFAHDVPVALLPVTRLDRLMHRNEVAVTAHRIRVSGEVVVFLSGNVRQQIIGKLGGRRHLRVDHNKALDQLRVLEQLGHQIAAGVLIDDIVALRFPHEFDIGLQGVGPSDKTGALGELVGFVNGTMPGVQAHGSLYRIGSGRKRGRKSILISLSGAVVGAGQPQLTGKNRQHGNGKTQAVTVGMTLRSPALRNKARLCRCDFSRQTNDRFARNTCDLGRPLRRLGDTVESQTENMALVVAVSGSGFGQRFFVVSNAVLIKESLINQIFLDHDVSHAFDQSRVRPRTNRHPFVFVAEHRVRVDRINHDDARLAFAQCAGQAIRLTAARSTRHGGVVAESDIKFCVGNLLHVRADICVLT